MGLAGGEDIEDALWLIKTGDSEVGPVSTDEMVAMIEAGEVSARTLGQDARTGRSAGSARTETALFGLIRIPSRRPGDEPCLSGLALGARLAWSS